VGVLVNVGVALAVDVLLAVAVWLAVGVPVNVGVLLRVGVLVTATMGSDSPPHAASSGSPRSRTAATERRTRHAADIIPSTPKLKRTRRRPWPWSTRPHPGWFTNGAYGRQIWPRSDGHAG
jgi:hypothetical protein